MMRELSPDEMLDILDGLEQVYSHPRCPPGFRDILEAYTDALWLDIIVQHHREAETGERKRQNRANHS